MTGWPVAGPRDARRFDKEDQDRIDEAEYRAQFPEPADEDQLDREEDRYLNRMIGEDQDGIGRGTELVGTGWGTTDEF